MLNYSPAYLDSAAVLLLSSCRCCRRTTGGLSHHRSPFLSLNRAEVPPSKTIRFHFPTAQQRSVRTDSERCFCSEGMRQFGGGFGLERNATLSLLSVCIALCFRFGSTYSVVNEVSGGVTGKKNSCVFLCTGSVSVWL